MEDSFKRCFKEGLSNHSFQIFTEHLPWAWPYGASILEGRTYKNAV